MNDIAVTVDTVVLARDADEQFTHVLLIKRKNPPFQGSWALPGGFLDPTDKTLRLAAARELWEETGLALETLWQVGAWGTPDRDPRGYTVTVAFVGVVDGPLPDVQGQDDALEAEWVEINFGNMNLAFDHDDIINRALLRAS